MLRDCRHALRAILRAPLPSTIIVLSLAVGIGANSTVFSWIEALVLTPLPGVGRASELYAVEPRAETGSYPGASWRESEDLRQQLTAFSGLTAFRMAPLNLGETGRTERAYGMFVSGDYFRTLELRPRLGRLLEPGDAVRPGEAPVAVISSGLWRTRFGAAPDVIGRPLRVNGQDLTVIGVTPEAFQGTLVALNFDIWMPATMAPLLTGGSRELDDRSMRGYSLIGRLRPGASLADAQAQIGRAMTDLARTYPETNAMIGGEVQPFWNAVRGPLRFFANALTILQGVMLLLLLAVCGNVASLLLARASTRQREIGIRLTLGGARWQIVRLLLVESGILAAAGTVLGVLLAAWATEAARAVPMIGAFPVRFQTRVDGIGLGVAAVLGLLAGLIVGVGPAWYLSRLAPSKALRAGQRTASRHPLRQLLMGAQVALATVVLVVAALFLRSLESTREIDPGFRRDGVLLAAYDFSSDPGSETRARTFAAELLARLRQVPSVEAAAIASSVPLDIHGMPLRTFTVEGRAREGGGVDQSLVDVVTPGYFDVMGIPLVAGRDFADIADAGPPPQAVVNEAFVARYLKDVEPLGRRVRFGGERTFTIVGIARTTTYEAFGEPPAPMIYLSYRDRPSARGEIHVRTRAGAETLLTSEIQRTVRGLDPMLPIYDVRTLGDHIEKNLFLRRIPARLFTVIGPILLLLAAAGIYAVVSHVVAGRRQEMALRMALGAAASRVVSTVTADSFRSIAAGLLLGWAMAFAFNLHIGSGEFDGWAFAGVPAMLLTVSGLACWLPARRAARENPMALLKQETQ